ncbi:MAG: metal-sensitive transcriptional regulator [Actinomycetes bacterium]
MRGYTEDTDALLRRPRRIEGQVRGLQRMVEADAYCIDILTRVSAATRALEAVDLQLLDDHLRHCVIEAAAGGELDVHASFRHRGDRRHPLPGPLLSPTTGRNPR